MATITHTPSADEQTATRSSGSVWLWVVAVSTAAAGGLHVAAAATHLGAHQIVVAFFLLVAFVQLGFSAWVAVTGWSGLRPDVRLVVLALAGTVGLVVLYVVAHTTDLLAGFAAHDAADASHGGASHGGASQITGPVALGLEPLPQPEPVTLLGTVTVTLEVLSVLALAALLPALWRRRVANGLLGLGVLLWGLWLLGVPG